MNTEDAWKNWWDSEGRSMERLPHHDAVDHLASMTRIAWLNGAFGAADEIERLRSALLELREAADAVSWTETLTVAAFERVRIAEKVADEILGRKAGRVPMEDECGG